MKRQLIVVSLLLALSQLAPHPFPQLHQSTTGQTTNLKLVHPAG